MLLALLLFPVVVIVVFQVVLLLLSLCGTVSAFKIVAIASYIRTTTSILNVLLVVSATVHHHGFCCYGQECYEYLHLLMAY